MTKIEKLLSVKSVISFSPRHTLELKGGGVENRDKEGGLKRQSNGRSSPPPWIAG